MFDILKAIIYGIVEGITEWLPISSTGHLILVEQILPFGGASEGFFEMFDVVIQLGAILAVVVLFWHQIWPFYKKNSAQSKARVVKGRGDPVLPGGYALSMDAFYMWVKIAIACLPAVVYGVLLDDEMEALFANEVPGFGVTVRVIVVAVMLILVGALFIIVENTNKNRNPRINSLSEITCSAALFIGLCQVVAAALPGTSRSGATIIGALMIGVSRMAAAEYTFFMAIPVMFGASLLKVVKFGLHFTSADLLLLAVGTAVSFVVSMFVLHFLVSYIKKHDFKVFGWYRIALGIVVLLYFGGNSAFS